MSPDFRPWRRAVSFLDCTETPIRPLIERLHFIEDPSRWGARFRFGVFTVDDHDFDLLCRELTGAPRPKTPEPVEDRDPCAGSGWKGPELVEGLRWSFDKLRTPGEPRAVGELRTLARQGDRRGPSRSRRRSRR